MNTAESFYRPAITESISILELSHTKARKHFLKDESYFKLDLPPYFVFEKMLTEISGVLNGKGLSNFQTKDPKCYEDINYTILNNIDGTYAWRPFQLIHPAIYVSLVHIITEEKNWQLIKEKFNEFSNNRQIECLSIPRVSLTEKKDKAKQIEYWLQEIEQKSIELSLDYKYLFETDITNCYGSIYTHTIPWALHTKRVAKEKKNIKSLLGNIIDDHIMKMNYGQTNCIPQGSVLMDFIAEMVLGYADVELDSRLKNKQISEYKILRYRDDYRIFYNNQQVGDEIAKALTEVLIDLGLKLNPEKTKVSDNVIKGSFKKDKLAWLLKKQYEKEIRKQILIIHEHSKDYPNSGSLMGALDKFDKRISKIKNYNNPLLPLISIVVDIAFHNPRTYPICAGILSVLINFLDDDEEKIEVIEKILKKFSIIPNTGHMEIWLQRATINFRNILDFNEPLCKIVKGDNVAIWNNCWISCKSLKDIVDSQMIISPEVLKDLGPIIQREEIDLFRY